jgi:hypothetical protein
MHIAGTNAARIAAAALALASCDSRPEQPPPASPEALAEKARLRPTDRARWEAGAKLGADLYAFGFPLVLMDAAERRMTNVAAESSAGTPVNQFCHAYEQEPAACGGVFPAEADMLVSTAWLDLTKEPIVLSVPDTRGRYYLMQMLDAWTNVFASPGSRTIGTQAGRFAILGPGWKGRLPAGVKELRSPTRTAWIVGRTQASGPGDQKAANEIQRQYQLTPLSALGHAYAAPSGVVDPKVDPRTPPAEQVARMGTQAFFKRLAALLEANPAAPEDAPMMERLASIGVAPGRDFDLGKLESDTARGLDRGVKVALDRLRQGAQAGGQLESGWAIMPPILGAYGTRYRVRAVAALMGLGAGLPQDVVQASAFVDREDRKLDGANKYVLHFPKGQTPPVNASWSLTPRGAQSSSGASPVAGQAIASWMPLQRNPDGSLDVYIQKGSPGRGRESNWLPAPPGPFGLTLRMYWPKEPLLDRTWRPPPVIQVQ